MSLETLEKTRGNLCFSVNLDDNNSKSDRLIEEVIREVVYNKYSFGNVEVTEKFNKLYFSMEFRNKKTGELLARDRLDVSSIYNSIKEEYKAFKAMIDFVDTNRLDGFGTSAYICSRI